MEIVLASAGTQASDMGIGLDMGIGMGIGRGMVIGRGVGAGIDRDRHR